MHAHFYCLVIKIDCTHKGRTKVGLNIQSRAAQYDSWTAILMIVLFYYRNHIGDGIESIFVVYKAYLSFHANVEASS